MKYKSQKVAYWFFALSMLLLSLQIIYGFIMGFAANTGQTDHLIPEQIDHRLVWRRF